MKALSPKVFQERLFRWFDKYGRKALPWQFNKTPYRIWVSEIMLQQTQVATVIPYFERFMAQFPDLNTLAKASIDDVLHLWAGLGYYSRARNLHQAAKQIMNQHEGIFPNTLQTICDLPGIGLSTAGAILSIAFNEPTPILDGNVKRVLARVHGITNAINAKKTEQTLWALASQYTPKKRVADYTQAMMDWGATLCTRNKPNCTACPFTKQCYAYQHDMTALLPQKKATRRLPVRIATLLILKKGRRVLLIKRPAKGIWGGLWSLPEVAGEPELKTVRQFCRDSFQLSVTRFTSQSSFRHTFSHYHLDIHPILIDARTLAAKTLAPDQQIWYNLSKPEAIGLPKPIQSIMRALT